MRTRRHRLTTALAVAVTLSACGTAPESEPSAADTSSDAPAEAATEDDAADETTSHEGSVTEATLQTMLDLDPDRAAAAHDHSEDHEDNGEHEDHEDHGEHGDHDDAVAGHPNGIDPERIVIPAIEVDADVIDLGLQDDGTMEVPTDFAQAGWFDRGPKPGRVGPAVIAGHVDSTGGPAVFFDLVELEPGDEIEVHGEDGALVTFAVRETQTHPKDDFPTEDVYAGTPGSELRLITCSGEFDADERSYRDNTIVFAERIDA